jgi:hypothetical protein
MSVPAILLESKNDFIFEGLLHIELLFVIIDDSSATVPTHLDIQHGNRES